MSQNFIVLLAVAVGSTAGYIIGFPAGAMVGGLITGLMAKGVMH